MDAVKVIANVETKRLFQAMEEVRRKKLEDNYGKISVEEYANLATASTLIQTWLPAISRFFEQEGHYILGLQRRDLVNVPSDGWKAKARTTAGNIFSATVKAQYELDRVNTDLLTWLDSTRQWMQHGQQIREVIKLYAANLEAGVQILSGHVPEKEFEHWDNKVTRLYASVLTWQKDDDLDAFLHDFNHFLNQAIFVILEGPVGVITRLSDVEYVVITELITGNEIKEDFIHAFKWIQGIFTKSSNFGVIHFLQVMLDEAIQLYIKSLTEGMTSARKNLHTEAAIRQFLLEYRNGVLFK